MPPMLIRRASSRTSSDCSSIRASDESAARSVDRGGGARAARRGGRRLRAALRCRPRLSGLAALLWPAAASRHCRCGRSCQGMERDGPPLPGGHPRPRGPRAPPRGLPLCRGQLAPPMDFGNAFHVVRELGRTGKGELLPLEALTAIHWTHRIFALVLLAGVLLTAVRVWRPMRALGMLLAALVVLQ